MKILGFAIRVLIFFALTVVSTGLLLLFGRTVVYDFLQIAPDDYSRPAIVFEIVVLILLAVIFFYKIVLQKSVRTPLIGLVFYLACHIVAIVFVTFNLSDFAPPFEWLAIVGMIAGLVVAKVKKGKAV